LKKDEVVHWDSRGLIKFSDFVNNRQPGGDEASNDGCNSQAQQQAMTLPITLMSIDSFRSNGS
jgi:hypothetical protein